MFTRLRDTILFSDEEYALRIKNEGLPNLHFDPVLEAHPAMWEGLWRELRDGGLVRWARTHEERVGMFLVCKKSGESRLICDARRSNIRFDIPDTLQLTTGDTLSRLEAAL
eukprot:7129594-Pyramimonas_sp.AAC.1